ncbi:MAG: ABC transporter ATP-binding protein, partial [Calditrichaeota bacterium]|nr:ABC transporter ATP-binding protein [Calditrichota bacterium]
FGGYYRTQKPVEELLDLVSLQDKRHSFHKNLSGGQQQRLALALALVNDPLIIFLDEPTTGLDPQARRNLWDIILKMRSADKSIILTTHYMEEAERLCDRIAIMDHGRVIAQGSPKELIGQLKVDSCIEFLSEGNADPEQLQKLPGVSRVTVIHQRVEIFSEAPQTTLTALLALSNTAGFAIG